MTTRELIGIDPVEPYSKVVKAGGLVFVKSQIGRDDDGEYPKDVKEQTKNTLAHLDHALEMAGTSIHHAVKLNVYLANIDDDFDGMNAGCREFFAERGVEDTPARTTIGVPLSWPQILVQMDIIAVGGDDAVGVAG